MKAVGRLIRTSSSVLWKASASPKCAQRKACRACLTLSFMHIPGRGGCDTSATAFLRLKTRDTLGSPRFDMCFKLASLFRYLKKSGGNHARFLDANFARQQKHSDLAFDVPSKRNHFPHPNVEPRCKHQMRILSL